MTFKLGAGKVFCTYGSFMLWNMKKIIKSWKICYIPTNSWDIWRIWCENKQPTKILRAFDAFHLTVVW